MTDTQAQPAHHPAASCLPELPAEEYEALKADIKARGLQQPIAMQSGFLIDGRHRLKACAELGIEAATIELAATEDVVAYVVSANIRRRHLSESQRAMVAARLEGFKWGGNRQRLDKHQLKLQPETSPANTSQHQQSVPLTRAEAARMLKVSERTIADAKKVNDSSPAEVVKLVEAGKVSVADAAAISDLAAEAQIDVVEEFHQGTSETLRGAKQVLDRAALAELPQPEQPTGTYSVIVMDPPWQMPDYKRANRPRKGGPEYPQMTLAEIEALPITMLADKDCWLFLWTTQGRLADAVALLQAWQFDYQCCLIWRKLTKDLVGTRGYKAHNRPAYTNEFVLVASRGRPVFTTTKDFTTIIDAPYRSHSQKPDEFYSLIKRVTHGSRLDYFARTQHSGFTAWGNEIPEGLAE